MDKSYIVQVHSKGKVIGLTYLFRNEKSEVTQVKNIPQASSFFTKKFTKQNIREHIRKNKKNFIYQILTVYT